jgi:hypothetical protein
MIMRAPVPQTQTRQSLHDTSPTVLRLLDPRALDAAFGRLTATLVATLAKGGLIEKGACR